MKIDKLEVYSDASNMAIIKHPGREYPGSLMQGDSLHSLLQNLIEAKAEIESGNLRDSAEILDEVINSLNDRLEHYTKVLKDHGIELPFSE